MRRGVLCIGNIAVPSLALRSKTERRHIHIVDMLKQSPQYNYSLNGWYVSGDAFNETVTVLPEKECGQVLSDLP